MIYIIDNIVNPIAVITTFIAIIVIFITHRYVLFERSARQSLAWIKEEGDIYLSTHTQVGNNAEETQQLLVEHNSFKEKARETREKVKLLLQLADTLVEKGHAHAPNIKQWVEEVDETYKNFSTRMDKYRQKVSRDNWDNSGAEI